MKERILMKRLKGLMALTVAFMLMFGSSLTVLAATTTYDIDDIKLKLDTNTDSDRVEVDGGTVITHIVGTGGVTNTVYLDDAEQTITTGYDKLGRKTWEYTIPQVTGKVYAIVKVEGDLVSGYKLWIESGVPASMPEHPGGSAVPAPTGGSGHLHTMEWIIGREPTETQDGLYQYKCTGCDYVEAQQPITYFGVIIKKIIKAIEEAPENGTVIIDNEFLRCFTDEIVAALLARPDVTVDVRFTEGEVAYRFLVPAGQAPTDGQEWYGYFYLGGVLYGWQAPVTEEEA